MIDHRNCSGCGQPIPPKAKLAERVLTRAQVAALQGHDDVPDAADRVTVNVCLQCQIRLARIGAI